MVGRGLWKPSVTVTTYPYTAVQAARYEMDVVELEASHRASVPDQAPVHLAAAEIPQPDHTIRSAAGEADSNTWSEPTKSAEPSAGRPVCLHVLSLVVIEDAWAAAHITSRVWMQRPFSRSQCRSVLIRGAGHEHVVVEVQCGDPHRHERTM